ncbi:MAG: hypothetical protein ACPGTP_01725 [Bacteroidia bacterium]
MKDLLLKSTKTVAILAALFGVITLNSCKDDEGEVTPTEEIVEDGMYVTGAATGNTGFSLNGLMSSTRNEVLNGETTDPRPELMEAFVALKADAAGFSIVNVAGTERTTYGPGADFASATGGNDEPQVDIQRGAIEESATVFTVPADGLYQVVFDTKTGRGSVTPVNWGIIGQATPTGWSGDTELDAPAFDMSSMTWESTGVAMSKGEWKFRFSGGWKIEIDSTEDLGNGNKGVKVNTNFGGAVDALVAGGANMNTDESGIYTVSMTWTAGEGHTASITRTGDLPARDYSAVSVGLIGDGVKDGNWDGEKFASVPTKAGDVYTWTYNGVELASAGGFKVRTEGTWDDINLGYDAGVIGGPDAADIQESGGNMQAKADGTYDIEFVIDAKAETMSLSFTKK